MKATPSHKKPAVRVEEVGEKWHAGQRLVGYGQHVLQ